MEATNLTKRYGAFTAVDHISFSVEQGTMLGFLGVNGAGKTTAINMLSTLLTPDDGSAEICGHRLGKEDARIRRKIGVVYQCNCLDNILTVQENLMCRGRLHGASGSEAAKQLDKLCEILKLGDILKKKYRMLSGGQRRRCEIAAALMHTPQILFLDEPTTGLDPATRRDVWNTIEALRKNEKMTVFLTTHYMEEAAAADQIIILDHGKIITSGTPFALKERFAMDQLKLYSSRPKVLMSLPELKNRPAVADGDCLTIPLPSTLEAIPLVNAARNHIRGFELIQGNMDDVFLNAVGKKLNTH